MKVMRGEKTDKGRKDRPVTKIVSVSEFLVKDGKAVGIKGLSYPDKTEISVTLTTTGDKAENPKRRDFEAYHKGFKVPNGDTLKIEPGAILRLNCVEKEPGIFEADWINVLAGSKETAQKSMSFGFAAVELFTPDPVKEKYREISARLKAANPNAEHKEISAALLEEIKGQVRYTGNVRQYHNTNIMEADGASLRDILIGYYGDGRFAKMTTDAGKSYEPVSPGVVIRALNSDGAVLAAVDVTGNMLYHAKAETPEERAAYAANLALENLSDGAVAYSILPYDRIRVSDYTMTVGEKTVADIKAFERAQRMSFKSIKDDAGNTDYEHFAMPAAVKAADNGMITEIAIPFGPEPVDIALLAKDGSAMREAVRQTEETSDAESNSPGM